MKVFLLLLLAAVLEVGGDALIRSGIKGRGWLMMLLGAVVLIAYGFMVNLTALDFSKLMGLYIVLFFLVAQAVALVFFRESMSLPVAVGGLLVIAGGITMVVWRPT